MEPPPGVLAFQPLPAGLRRLTQEQYLNTVRDIFGIEVTSLDLEPDVLEAGFRSMGAYQVAVSPAGVEKDQAAALAVTAKVFSDPQKRAALLGCDPASVSDPCVDKYLEGIGLRLWRRPLTKTEIDPYRAFLLDQGPKLQDTWLALQLTTAALMMSPRFTFVAEPTVASGTKGILRLGDYALASRLSYSLWNTTPDPELLAAAGRGELSAEAGIAAQVQRLLSSPRSGSFVRGFFREMLAYEELDGIQKDPDAFPDFNAAVGKSMLEELDRFTVALATDPQANAMEIYTRGSSWVDADLAKLYGVQGPASGFAETKLPADRSGILTLAGVLAVTSTADRTSPTTRGVFVRERLLCQEVPVPPANVEDNENLTSPIAGKTMRERLAQHRERSECASCHAFIDPIGLGLENYDGIGKYRLQENGATIDASGELDGVPFANGVELTAAIAKHPATADCLVSQLFGAITGHRAEKEQEALVQALKDSFRSSGYRMRALMSDIVSGPVFRFARSQGGGQ